LFDRIEAPGAFRVSLGDRIIRLANLVDKRG
jgi:hypothetical protein